MEKVLELLKLYKEKKKIEEKKKEMETAFIKEFGIEPVIVTVAEAERIIDTGPALDMAVQLLRDLGYNPRYTEIELHCSRTREIKETDWTLNEYGIGMHKYSNGFYYQIKIYFEEDEDC